VRADHEADGVEMMAVLGHVERRHRHHERHHDLADDQCHDRDQHGGPAQELQHGRCRPSLCAGGAREAGVLLRQLIRIGPQCHEREQRGRSDERRRHEVRPGQVRQPGGRRDRHREREQVGSDDRADRGAPDDRRDRRRATPLVEHVGGRVARELVRAVPEPDQHGPEQEQRQ
jgi:hypothetical protein